MSTRYVVHAEFCHEPGDESVESQVTYLVVLREGHQRYYCRARGAEVPWRELGAPQDRVLLKDRIKMDQIRSF